MRAFSTKAPCVALALILGLTAPSAAQETGIVTGRVTVAESGEPAAGAQIDAVAESGAVAARTTANGQGAFQLTGLAPGTYTLVASLFGHQTQRIAGVRVVAGGRSIQAIELVPAAFELDPLTVTASRRQEKALDAPATVDVVDRLDVEERSALTAIDHVRSSPGVDIATTGLMQSNVVARGFNNVFSGALLMLTDNRIASVPSLRVNASYLIPSTNEDIERIEVVLGPGAALYGPNSANGVMHVVTRSPFDSRGTTASFAAGMRAGSDAERTEPGLAAPAFDQGVYHATVRHAGVINDAWAYKFSVQMVRGGDWPYFDPAEDEARSNALAAGADADTLLIGARDFDVERWTGEARIDYRPAAETEVVFSAGASLAENAIELTGIGAAQGKGWRYNYYQLRARRGRLFAQAFLNTSDAGDTYLLRTGQPIVDNSRMFVAQAQHISDLGDRQTFTYGIDFQDTRPNTDGTITGRNEDDDEIVEWGGYVHSETRLADRFNLLAAARLDTHSRLSDPVFSPRTALVYKPEDSHTFRVTYNRAFSTPTTNNLFLDIVAGRVGPLPFDVRAVGVPADGFRFPRDCPNGVGGYCMRSPFYDDPAVFLPADATPFWNAVVQIAGPGLQQAFGIDLASVPAPPPGEVGSALRVLNTTKGIFEPVDASDIRDVDPLRPTINNTFEAGYNGILSDRVRLTADVYYERRKDFIGPLIVETPNVFFDEAELRAYLSNHMSGGNARIAASAIATQIPVGTISPDHELTNGPGLLVTYRNFGEVDLWGADLAAEVVVGERYAVRGAYSFVSRDFFDKDEVGGVSDVALNAPQHKGNIGGRYRGESGLSAELRARYVRGFPVNSGVFIGIGNDALDSYTLLDANLVLPLPFGTGTTLTITAQNLLNNMHREFIGAPELGALVLTRLRFEF